MDEAKSLVRKACLASDLLTPGKLDYAWLLWHAVEKEIYTHGLDPRETSLNKGECIRAMDRS